VDGKVRDGTAKKYSCMVHLVYEMPVHI